MSLTLKKNGILIHTKWDSDKGEYVDEQIGNDYAVLPHLHHTCDLEAGLTLRDIMAFAKKNKDLLQAMMPRLYILEFVADAEKSVPEKEDKWVKTDYLELYTYLEKTNKEHEDSQPKDLHGMIFPSFHGVGTVQEDDENSGFKKGDQINLSLMMAPTSTLLDYEVKIKPVVTVENAINYQEPVMTIDAKPSYSLFQILYGIFWELSWYGSPEEKTEKVNEIIEIGQSIKENTANLSDFDDLNEEKP